MGSSDEDDFGECDEFYNNDPHQLQFCQDIHQAHKGMLKMPSLVDISRHNGELSLFQKIAYYDNLQVKQK